jgi:GxxExxY protein
VPTPDVNDITEKIIGFAEKVFENALVHEIQKSGLKVAQQIPIKVFYDEIVVGDCFADLLVEEQILVELKAVSILKRLTNCAIP